VSFAAITLRVASQRVFIVVVDFIIDSVRKFLDTLLYICVCVCVCSYTSVEQSSSPESESLSWSTNSPPFMEPELSFLCSEEPATGPCFQPDESSPHSYFL
jgi:hypothetical protein